MDRTERFYKIDQLLRPGIDAWRRARLARQAQDRARDRRIMS
jgi:hypothetical protein